MKPAAWIALFLLAWPAPRAALGEEPPAPPTPSGESGPTAEHQPALPSAGVAGATRTVDSLGAVRPLRARMLGRAGSAFVPPPRFLRDLFPPALVMRHQRDIALSPDQRSAISELMKEAQGRMIDLQWEVEAASQALADLVAGATVDERAALQEADRLMRAEQELKRAHLALLIRVKNRLSASQQGTLREKAPADVVFFRSAAPELQFNEALPLPEALPGEPLP
jgi:hypothetical protein